MIKNLQRLCILIILAAQAQAQAGPKLNKDQVSRIGEVVIEKSHREYQGWFDLKNPSYDDKTQIWSFSNTKNHLPTVVGEIPSRFDVRDSDGFVIIGKFDYHFKRHKSLPKFKMPNNCSQYIRKIISE